MIEICFIDRRKSGLLSPIQSIRKFDARISTAAEIEGGALGSDFGGGGGSIARGFLSLALGDSAGQGAGVSSVSAGVVLD